MAPVFPQGTCAAIISPHGSLDYSGTLAAMAWKAASAGSFDTIIILSPSHRSFESGIFLPEAHHFAVPTGLFKVDRHLVKRLIHSTTNLSLSDIPHFEEHSIEMQLIFAAHCFPEAQILPIIISMADDKALDSLFLNLQFALGKRLATTLFVLTTNLAVDENIDRSLAESAAFVESIEREKSETLHTFCDEAPSFCGGHIIAAYLRSPLSAGLHPKVFGVGSSAAFAEKGEPIVGYAAIGFSR